MIHIIDFYESNTTNEEKSSLLGSVTITENGEYRITGGSELSNLVKEDLEDGIQSFDRSERLFPKDGHKFIDRLLQRYSGSRVWARLKED